MIPDNFKKLKSVLPQNELQNTLESPKLLHEALIEYDLYDGDIFKYKGAIRVAVEKEI